MAELLRTMLEKDKDAMFDMTDKELVLYYMDHKKEILAQCETKYLTPDDMAKYKYRPERYLFDNRFPKMAYWLFCWINDLSGSEEFINLSSVKLPNFSYLESLYSTYRTLRSKMKTANEYLNEK